jgi:hypothetical protein
MTLEEKETKKVEKKVKVGDKELTITEETAEKAAQTE